MRASRKHLSTEGSCMMSPDSYLRKATQTVVCSPAVFSVGTHFDAPKLFSERRRLPYASAHLASTATRTLSPTPKDAGAQLLAVSV